MGSDWLGPIASLEPADTRSPRPRNVATLEYPCRSASCGRSVRGQAKIR